MFLNTDYVANNFLTYFDITSNEKIFIYLQINLDINLQYCNRMKKTFVQKYELIYKLEKIVMYETR